MLRSRIKALIMDWDETITEQDTISLVSEAAYLTKPSFPTKWDHFCELYYSNYKQYTQDFGPRNSVEDELKFQKGLKQIEVSSVNEYVGLQLFADVDHETLAKQSEKVDIKPNFFKVFSQLYSKKTPVFILSCNWTSIIMSRIFQKHGFEVNNSHFQIVTNEFEHRNQVLTGEVNEEVSIRTGADKVEYVKKIIKDLKLRGDNIEDGVYYIGDSTTDILPMLEADCGIVIGNGSALSTLEKLQIPVDNGIEGDARIKHIHDWVELEPLI